MKIKKGKCYIQDGKDRYAEADVLEVGKRKSLIKMEYQDTVLGMRIKRKQKFKISNKEIIQE